MSDESLFGPDRENEPGLTSIPHAVVPPQVVEFAAESMGLHSRSQGWLPAVKIMIASDDGSGFTCCIEVGPELDKILNDLRLCAQAARRDVAVAIRKGMIS